MAQQQTRKPAPPAKQATKPAPQDRRPVSQASRPASPAPAPKPAPAAGPAPGTQVAQRQTTAVANVDVPDYIKNVNRGSENVDMQDVVIPRIELIHSLSPCVDKNHAAYIEGAEPGMFFNSVTRKLYGENVLVCPVFFRKQWLAWRDRKKGGGFGGAYDNHLEAQQRIDQEENAPEWEAIETAQQLVLVVDRDTYETEEAIVSMSRTKLKVSRQWNSLIRINGFDRFSRLYSLFSVDETNTVNQAYKNIGVGYVDWAPLEVYKKAEALYLAVAEGARKVVVDSDYEKDAIDAERAEQGAPAGGGTPEY